MKTYDCIRLLNPQRQYLKKFRRFAFGCKLGRDGESKAAVIGRVADQYAACRILIAHPIYSSADQCAADAFALMFGVDSNRAKREPARRVIGCKGRGKGHLPDHDTIAFGHQR